MRSEILGKEEPMEKNQNDAERRQRGPGLDAGTPKDTECVIQMDGRCYISIAV